MDKLKGLSQSLKVTQHELNRMKAQVARLHENEGVKVEEEFHDDLSSIMYQQIVNVYQKFSEDSFQRIFWNQQMHRHLDCPSSYTCAGV